MNGGTITKILAGGNEPPDELADRLVPLVYDSMRRMAQRQMSKERAQLTLQPTALVHEAYMRVMVSGAAWNNRRHFYSAIAEAMRRILIDFARRRGRFKRGGDFDRVTLESAHSFDGPDTISVIEIDRAIAELAKSSPRNALVVRLRYFAGLTIRETADVLELSPATVKGDWAYARAWLHRRLAGDTEAPR